MKIDFETCYQAMMSKDPRFDGLFFTGVLTTGIYCRPICPARKPHKENIRFYRTAAEAEAAGLRPCLRCRPETTPSSPVWNGTATTVKRGLRLIQQGFLDTHSVTELADILGMGSRHLRRLFQEHIGAAPLSLALIRRLHLARILLATTQLPVSAIAFSSGCNSIKQFHTLFKKHYHQPPSAFRTRAKKLPADSPPVNIALDIAYHPPYDWDAFYHFLAPRIMPFLETLEPDAFSRLVVFGKERGIIKVHYVPEKNALRLLIPSSLQNHIFKIVNRVQRMFDTNTYPAGITRHLQKDALLGSMIRKTAGLRIPGAWDPFELGVRAILGQQISVKAASTLMERLVRQCGTPVETRDAANLSIAFPTPAALAGANLESLGLTRTRAQTIRDFSSQVAGGLFTRAETGDPGQLIQKLLQIKGIGSWTAGYIALRGFSHADGFPEGDLGLIKAAGKIYGTLSAKELTARAEAWKPWRGYAAFYLWHSL